jgi:hypothetical protein
MNLAAILATNTLPTIRSGPLFTEACEEGTIMGEERRFPCPYCGYEFHYTPDEPRLSVPCSKCGKKLIMPHGSFNRKHATPGIGVGEDWITREPVFGLESGGHTREELESLSRRNAIGAIRRWEEVAAKPLAGSEQCRAAELEVYWALWSFPGKSIILDGKRYKGISRVKGLSVSVTPAPEKKRRKGPSSGEAG